MPTATEEAIVRGTILIAVGLFFFTLLSRLACRPRLSKVAKGTWTVGLGFYIAHVLSAFAVFHGWSHQAAYAYTAAETARLIGVAWGGGIYFNHGFTMLWIVDAVWWWIWPTHYGSRGRRYDVAVMVAMLLMVFQATVVFANGPARWFGAAGTLAAVILALARRRWALPNA